MKPKVIFPLIIIATIVASLQCHKHKDQIPTQLPPITEEGKNTFGCKVDGEVWVPYYKCGGTGNPCGEIAVDIFPLNMQNTLPVQLDLNIGRRDQNNSQTFFQINTPTNSGIFTIGNKIDSVKFKYTKPGSIEYIEIPGMDASNNFIITKLDTANKIISGTFQATLYRSLSDSVKITEGRFDLKFQVCKCSN